MTLEFLLYETLITLETDITFRKRNKIKSLEIIAEKCNIFSEFF